MTRKGEGSRSRSRKRSRKGRTGGAWTRPGRTSSVTASTATPSRPFGSLVICCCCCSSSRSRRGSAPSLSTATATAVLHLIPFHSIPLILRLDPNPFTTSFKITAFSRLWIFVQVRHGHRLLFTVLSFLIVEADLPVSSNRSTRAETVNVSPANGRVHSLWPLVCIFLFFYYCIIVLLYYSIIVFLECQFRVCISLFPRARINQLTLYA